MKDYAIKILKQDDVTNDYVMWLKDEEVVKFSDNSFRDITISGQKKYVKDIYYWKR